MNGRSALPHRGEGSAANQGEKEGNGNVSDKRKGCVMAERENRSIIYYRMHDAQHIRVWRPFWSSVHYELMPKSELEAGVPLLQRLGFRVVEADDD